MKICFVSNSVYGLFNPEVGVTYGGAELQMYLWATTLAAQGEHEVHFVVGDFGQPAKEVREGVSLHKAVKIAPADGKLKKMVQALQILRMVHAVQADVYVTSAPNPVVGLLSWYCRAAGKKHVYRSASTIDCNGEFIAQQGIMGRCFQYGLEKADLVVSQHEASQELLRQHHGIRAPILRNGYSQSGQPLSFAERDSILWVSRYDYMKQPEVFLRLAQAFPEESFVMICPPNKAYPEQWEQLQEDADKISNLRFVPGVHLRELAPYFERAKIFVNSSSFEGFPNTFVQAGLRGVPLLSLSIDPNGFIADKDCGAVADGDEALLQKQLKALLEDQALWERQSKTVREYMLEHHDLNNNMQQFTKLLSSLSCVD